MKRKALRIAGFVWVFLLGVEIGPGPAQDMTRTFTLHYSNNINGEIEPCPS